MNKFEKKIIFGACVPVFGFHLHGSADLCGMAQL